MRPACERLGKEEVLDEDGAKLAKGLLGRSTATLLLVPLLNWVMAKLRPGALSKGFGDSATCRPKPKMVEVPEGVGVVGLDGAPEAVECIDWSMLAGWQARL